jgi:hypothetical protein
MSLATKQAERAQSITLRQLSEEAAALDALVDMDEGEWTDDHEALEKELAAKLVKKADGYGDFLATQNARIALLKAEEERLARRRRAIEAQVKRLKRNAAWALQHAGLDRVEGEYWRLKVSPTPPKLVLADDLFPESLPSEFVRVVPATLEFAKAEIKRALQAGTKIPGASLESDFTVRVS